MWSTPAPDLQEEKPLIQTWLGGARRMTACSEDDAARQRDRLINGPHARPKNLVPRFF